MTIGDVLAVTGYPPSPKRPEIDLVPDEWTRAVASAQGLPLNGSCSLRRETLLAVNALVDAVIRHATDESAPSGDFAVAAGQTSAQLALFKAMNEAGRVGSRSDEKLIQKALAAAGLHLVRSVVPPMAGQRLYFEQYPVAAEAERTNCAQPEAEERDPLYVDSKPGDLGDEIVRVGIDRRRKPR